MSRTMYPVPSSRCGNQKWTTALQKVPPPSTLKVTFVALHLCLSKRYDWAQTTIHQHNNAPTLHKPVSQTHSTACTPGATFLHIFYSPFSLGCLFPRWLPLWQCTFSTSFDTLHSPTLNRLNPKIPSAVESRLTNLLSLIGRPRPSLFPP